MKLYIKITAMALCFSIFAASLAGCTENKKAASGDAPVEVSVFGWSFEHACEDEDSPIYKALKEKLNIKIKPVIANVNNWEEKLNVIMASGDIPDVFMSRGVVERQESFLKWIKEGMIIPISDYSAEYPNITKVFDEFDELKNMQGGKHYGLPVMKFDNMADVTAANNLWIRKDWLDKLGLQVPTTIDEFYNVAKAFAENDPDGNGIRDTYGYTTTNALWSGLYIVNSFNTSYKLKRKVGDKWVAECTTDEMKQAIQFFKKMYDEKILDQEFMINTDEKMTEKFVSSKVGMMHRNGEKFYNGYYDRFKNAYPGKDPESMFTWAPVLEGKNGIKRLEGTPNFWCMTSISSKADETKRKKAIELLDYLLSDEGKMLTRYGIEGENYKKDGENIVNLIPPSEKGDYRSIEVVDETAKLKYLARWDTSFIPAGMPHSDKIKATIDTNKDEYIYRDPLRYLAISDSLLTEAKPKQLEDFMMESFVNLVSKSTNFDSDWNTYVKKWNDMGGRRLMEIITQAASEQGY